MQSRTQNPGVFFTGVQLNVEPTHLRRLFESIGHVVDFRLLGPSPGKDFRFGLVEYSDSKTAEDAIARLNGHMLGERAIHVTVPKPRATTTATSSFRGGLGSGAKRRREQYVAEREPAKDLVQFPRHFNDPALGRDDSIVLERLRGMEVKDAYEAVEQLRVLALERKHEARLLLQDNPALRSAVVMILQHAGKLPMHNLPAAAFQSAAAAAEAAAQRAKQTAAATGGGGGGSGGSGGSAGSSSTPVAASSAPAAAPVPATTEEQRDEVLQIISSMSEADVERVATMSDADLASIPDVAQRKQLEVLRDRLLEMSNEL